MPLDVDGVFDAFAPSIRHMESGSPQGNYGAVGPVDRHGDKPYGAYQVMGANVGPWTAKYYGTELTPQQFLQNQAAQDAVFKGEFGRLAGKYGPIGAAIAWHGGEGGLKNPGAMDVLGTSNADYVAQFAKLAGEQPPAASGALTATQPAPAVSAALAQRLTTPDITPLIRAAFNAAMPHMATPAEPTEPGAILAPGLLS